MSITDSLNIWTPHNLALPVSIMFLHERHNVGSQSLALLSLLRKGKTKSRRYFLKIRALAVITNPWPSSQYRLNHRC